jgi:hypothetical protein
MFKPGDLWLVVAAVIVVVLVIGLVVALWG